MDFTLRYTLPAAHALLPPVMQSVKADAHLLAIALQESDFAVRRQRGGGPARSFLQFERGEVRIGRNTGGVAGILAHPRTRAHVLHALSVLQYPTAPTAEVLRICFEAVAHNDPLAFACGRLLLWTLPDRLPDRTEADAAWDQYLRAWNPGKPHPEKWERCFSAAWHAIDGEQHTS
jgi:hypothetical protein